MIFQSEKKRIKLIRSVRYILKQIKYHNYEHLCGTTSFVTEIECYLDNLLLISDNI